MAVAQDPKCHLIYIFFNNLRKLDIMKKLSTCFYLAGLAMMGTKMDPSVKNLVRTGGDSYLKTRRYLENIEIQSGVKKSFCQ